MGKASRRKRERKAYGGSKVPLQALPPPLASTARDDPGKISEKLGALVLPLAPPTITLEEYRSLIALGAVAWNLSILGSGYLKEAMEQLDSASREDREHLEEAIAGLVQRKQDLFADDQRVIVHWEVTLRPDGRFHLTAAALS